MTTKRPKVKGTSRKGVNFTKNVVESCNSIFQEIHQENDVGNDAYIEFINKEEATSFCIAAQIKTGASYVSKDGSTFLFNTDRDHFEYWANHILPIAGIIFNPETKIAVWSDITGYLKENPEVIRDGPYKIKIPSTNIFSEETFVEFQAHFFGYRDKYQKDANFGKSLEYFATFEDKEKCSDGIKSLFFNHRNRKATWYYLISSFSRINDLYLRKLLCLCIVHIPGHGDVLWHSKNIIDKDVRSAALDFIKSLFGKDEVISLLELVDEYGYERGQIGQSIHAIVDCIKNRNETLKLIAFDGTVSEKIKIDALLLLIYYYQIDSTNKAIDIITEYLRTFPNSEYSQLLYEIQKTLRKYGSVGFY